MAVSSDVAPTTVIDRARVLRHGLTKQVEETLSDHVPLLLVAARAVTVGERGLTLTMTAVVMRTPMISMVAAAAMAAQATERVDSGEQVVPAGAAEVVAPAVLAEAVEVLQAQGAAGRPTGAQMVEMMAVGLASF